MKHRPPCPLPDPDSRRRLGRKGHREPSESLTLDQAMAEAARCLSRHQCDGCEVCQLLCPDQAVCRDPETGRPLIDLRYCKGCGLCAGICPKGAIRMEQETAAD